MRASAECLPMPVPAPVTSATLVAVAMGSCPPCLFLAVDVEPDFFLTVGHGDVSLGRGDDDGLAGRRWSEFFRQVHRDGQDVSGDGHLHVLHGSPPADSLAQNRAPRLARSLEVAPWHDDAGTA